MKKACVITNGCPENRIDGAGLKQLLEESGWTLADAPEDCDLIVFNACALTLYQEECSINAIEKLKSMTKKGARLLVCGCLSQISRERLGQVHDGVTLLSDDFASLSRLIGAAAGRGDACANFLNPRTGINPGFSWKIRVLANWLDPVFLMGRIRHRAYDRLYENAAIESPDTYCIKAATGCLSACSYCAVKISRGRLSSKPISGIVAEYERGLARGFKVFAILGTDVGCYGFDQGTNLAILLRTLIQIDNESKIKVRNVQPTYLLRLLPELMEVFRSGRICYLSSAFESGSNRILELMHRGYRIEDYKRAITSIRTECPHIRLVTQVMVGFPSETEEEFAESLRLLDEVSFDFVEAYGFSSRQGTEAALLAGQIPERLVRRRYDRLVRKIVRGITARMPAGPHAGRWNAPAGVCAS